MAIQSGYASQIFRKANSQLYKDNMWVHMYLCVKHLKRASETTMSLLNHLIQT